MASILSSSFSLVLLPSTNPKLSNLGTSLSIFSHSSFTPISLSASFSRSLISSRFVPKVSLSADLSDEEETFSDEDDDRRSSNFSPDLKLFVGNLAFNVDSSQLASLFESAGNVEMVEVIYDKVTGRSRGFGFVTMATAKEVEAAAQQFNGYEFQGRPLRVNFEPPPPKESASPFNRGSRFGSPGGGGGGRGGGGSSYGSSNRLYIGNLPWSVDDLALQNLFSEQGKVVEAKVVYDRDSGRSRGFGFVTYGSSEEVDSAIENLDGAELAGRSIRVSVAEAKQRREF